MSTTWPQRIVFIPKKLRITANTQKLTSSQLNSAFNQPISGLPSKGNRAVFHYASQVQLGFTYLVLVVLLHNVNQTH